MEKNYEVFLVTNNAQIQQSVEIFKLKDLWSSQIRSLQAFGCFYQREMKELLSFPAVKRSDELGTNCSYLNTASQHLIEDVSPFLHHSDIHQGGVCALTILDGVDESIPEFLNWAKQILLNEVNHAVI